MTQISQFVRRAVQTGAGKIATVCGDRQRTWREFDERIRRLAGAMHGLGLKPATGSAILSLNSDRYLESLFGLSLGGFVFVPINTRLAPPEIVFWLADSGCSALFVDDAFVPVLPKVLPETPDVETSGLHRRERGAAPTWSIMKNCWRALSRSRAQSVQATISRAFFTPEAPPAGPRA